MSGLELPGLIVGLVPIVFKATVEAWKIFDDTVSFAGDCEDLGIRIETLKAHLHIWANKAGLTEGALREHLRPFEELIARTLKRICELMDELEQHGTKYGIEISKLEQRGSTQANKAIVQMRRSLHTILSNAKGPKKNIVQKIQSEATGMTLRSDSSSTKLIQKVYWAVIDKQKFESFVNVLEHHVNGLQTFILEHDRNEIRKEGTRLAYEIIRGLSEAEALLSLRQVPENNRYSQVDISTLARWKAIALNQTGPSTSGENPLTQWRSPILEASNGSHARLIRQEASDPHNAYLFEKKEYNPNIADDEKDILKARILQLIALLKEPKSQRHLNTLPAVGYVDDTEHHCWWIIFRFPMNPLHQLDNKAAEPLSLRDLYKSSYKPSLESRYKLARRLVDSFARLYGSEWYHKGLNSRNIIFPHIRSAESASKFRSINTALIQGFNYSRQLTQAQTIDRGKVLHDLEAAIYRHPLYQGDAASGYQIQYDIYSLGLVLFEIAIWGPLIDLFRPGKNPPVVLSPGMTQFHEPEALELKRRIDIRVKDELAYRVGTKYTEVVQWCLNLQGSVTALDFYNTVAIPLEELCEN